ncbi:MAG: hypothetical protein CMO97_03370 [Woeseia sp.]|nr:hypothetical protein [Woeseia sp.]|tara:strand:- start:911 stop:1558 length:648 start_codon:yes stop_codon:yes gene_type:complete
MIKHIGRHGEKKVVVVYRTIPDQDHMALVVYPDNMPTSIHDPIMMTLESTMGQQQNVLADALFKQMLPDGRNQLKALHEQGFLKKVQTSQIVMTPDPKSSVRLDELNKLVKEMETGDEARAKLAQADADRGIQPPPSQRASTETVVTQTAPQPTQAPSAGALSDEDLALNLMEQSKQMVSNAKGMMKEADRLKNEARVLQGKKPIKKTAKKKTSA